MRSLDLTEQNYPVVNGGNHKRSELGVFILILKWAVKYLKGAIAATTRVSNNHLIVKPWVSLWRPMTGLPNPVKKKMNEAEAAVEAEGKEVPRCGTC